MTSNNNTNIQVMPNIKEIFTPELVTKFVELYNNELIQYPEEQPYFELFRDEELNVEVSCDQEEWGESLNEENPYGIFVKYLIIRVGIIEADGTHFLGENEFEGQFTDDFQNFKNKFPQFCK